MSFKKKKAIIMFYSVVGGQSQYFTVYLHRPISIHFKHTKLDPHIYSFIARIKVIHSYYSYIMMS